MRTMNGTKKFISLMVLLMLVCSCFAGCGSKDVSTSEGSEAESTDFFKTDEEMFTDRDMDFSYDENEAVTIELQGDTAKADSDSVKISGSTITITENKTHIISGDLSDGMIIVDTDESAKLQLVFDGVDIVSRTSAALYVKEADKVFITLAEGSQNSLANDGEFATIDDNNIDGALFSKQDITVNGSGSLTVTSPAGHGIVCKDDLVLVSCSLDVSSASHGLDANDSVRIKDTSFEISAGKDGIHSENSDDETLGFVYASSGTLDIEAEGDGISGSYFVQIQDGDFDIISGGGSVNGSKESSENWGGFMGGMPGGHGKGPGSGDANPMANDPGTNRNVGAADNAAMLLSSDDDDSEDSSTSMKGIKSGNGLLISNGNVTIDSADDALHSNRNLIINGGNFNLATGDDGVHAEEKLTVTSGKINITESYEGLEALDIEIRGGDIALTADDDGLNAAGGVDSSGTEGGRDGMFGGAGQGGPGGQGGQGTGNSDGSVVISGGTLDITASGDGIDANGYIEISGGYTTVVGPTQGDTATLDYDTTATITGGTFIGTGASNMAQTFSDSSQGVIAISVGSQTAGTEINIADDNGKSVLAYSPKMSYQVVIVSNPDIESGASYEVTVGSTSGTIQAS